MSEQGQEDSGLAERLAEGIKQLKTQRLLPIFGQTFLIAESATLYNSQKRDLVFFGPSMCKMLGIKDKGSCNYNKSSPTKPSDSASSVIYCLLVCALLFSSLYPVLIDLVPGTIFQRLYGRFLINTLVVFPIAFIEITRKSADGFSFDDVLSGKTLWINYRNSLFICGWNVCFAMALKYTELSSILFLSNLMLASWVINKVVRRTSRIAESEVSGLTFVVIGFLIFGLKQLITGLEGDQMTSLFIGHSYLGVFYSILATLCGTFYFHKNYDLNYYLPSYTTLLLISIFNLANLEMFNIALPLVFPNNFNFDILTFSSRRQLNKQYL
jgi:hypothetical protein